MDLEEFIASTLQQICKGVHRAQNLTTFTDEMADQTAWIAPTGTGLPPLEGAALVPMGGEDFGYLQNVRFDVAVTVSDRREGGGQAGVKVLEVVGASLGRKVAAENVSASRVQFEVPVILPGIRLSEREGMLHEAREKQKAALAQRRPRAPY